MKIYLAGDCYLSNFESEFNYDFFRLDTFISLNEKKALNIPKYKDFILDSGAFTFMNSSSGKDINWNEYIEKYASFINKHNIDKFFELDIDNIVGIREVENLRYKLEKLTNKQCIPVWHKSRGEDYFDNIIKNYGYIAIGGIVTKEIKKSEFMFLKYFLNKAKKQKCKVHGLGFTYLDLLDKIPFFSVDSSFWMYGNLNGYANEYKGGLNMLKHKKGKGQLVNQKMLAKHNFNEWLKLQKYAEINL